MKYLIFIILVFVIAYILDYIIFDYFNFDFDNESKQGEEHMQGDFEGALTHQYIDSSRPQEVDLINTNYNVVITTPWYADTPFPWGNGTRYPRWGWPPYYDYFSNWYTDSFRYGLY